MSSLQPRKLPRSSLRTLPSNAFHKFCNICSGINIDISLSLSYPPQSSSQVKHQNQEMERCWRWFCSSVTHTKRKVTFYVILFVFLFWERSLWEKDNLIWTIMVSYWLFVKIQGLLLTHFTCFSFWLQHTSLWVQYSSSWHNRLF